MTFRSVAARCVRGLCRLVSTSEAPPPLVAPDPFGQWIDGFAGRSRIHPTLELTGIPQGYESVQIGDDVTVERDVTVWLSADEGSCPSLIIGSRSFVGRNSYLGAYQPLNIGSSVMIGAYCYITSANHVFARRDIPIRDQGFTGAPVTIEEDAWLGTHVVVLPGVVIGRGAIIAAGSIVNRSVPPYEVWGGTPAKFLKHRPA